MSEELLPPEGLIIDYSNMTPMLVLNYDSPNNTLVFNNPIQSVSGLSTAEYAPLGFQISSTVQKSSPDWNSERSTIHSDASARRPCDPQPTDVSNKRNDSSHRYHGGEGRRHEILLRQGFCNIHRRS